MPIRALRVSSGNDLRPPLTSSLRKHSGQKPRGQAASLARVRGHPLPGAGGHGQHGPARAIRCALAIREAVREIGLEVRLGLHTGECEVLDGKVAGIAVAIGARVSARAAAGEVLVSQTVKDLVAGSGIGFEDRGLADLKGVPGQWRLYAVTSC